MEIQRPRGAEPPSKKQLMATGHYILDLKIIRQDLSQVIGHLYLSVKKYTHHPLIFLQTEARILKEWGGLLMKQERRA